MQMMDGISKVLQRIGAIEYRFMQSSQSFGDFSDVYTKAIQDTSVSNIAQQTANSSSSDIVKMIQISAQKYGVDPKLATAVAQVESNYSPQVVSSAGAVGVMQLMPDTAKGLGVRNIYDPRENIDGGVAYLKQLLTTFNGDVTKAVAAYNAGAQAVKSYNGVPPYPETRNYVAKVLKAYQQ